MFDFGTFELSLEHFSDYLTKERRNSPSTVQTYGNAMRQYAMFVKSGGVADVRAPRPCELQTYLNSLCDKLNPNRRIKPRTQAIHICALRSFYRWLAIQGEAEKCAIRPVLNLEKPKLDETLGFVLSREKMIELLDAPRHGMNRERDKAILEVFYSTGCRVSELVNMQIADLDMREGKVRAKVKGGGERYFILGRYAISSIIAYLTWGRPKLAKRCPDSPWLFVGRGSKGRPMTRETVWHLVQKYGELIATESRVTPHVLRRTAATHLIMNGAPLAAVKAFLGHKSVEVTQKYLRLDPSYLKQIHDSCHPLGLKRQTQIKPEQVMQHTTELVLWPEAAGSPAAF